MFEEPVVKEIKCECGEACDVGMKIIEMPEEKVKIQIFDSKEIKTIVIKKKLLKEL